MAKLDLALVVRTVDQATRPLRRIQKTVRDIGRQTGLAHVGRDLRRVGRQVGRVGVEAARFGKRFGLLAAGISALLGGTALKAFGLVEQMEVSFESMLGSGKAAKKMIKDLSQFAATTPFQLTGIGAASKTLLAFGVKGDEIIDKLQFLGDIAAGAGIPLKDLAQIYGKSMAKGKAQTEELNQMAERGIPILEALVKLAAKYGNEISKEDVYKAAERGQISFKAIEEALQSMTAEGGIFNEQMQKQSKTLFGLASTVKDNVFLAFAELGDQIEETFQVKESMRGLIVWLGELVAEMKKPAEAQQGFAKTITSSLESIKGISETIGAALGAVGDLLNTDLGQAILAIVDEVGALELAFGALALFMGAGLLTAIGGLIAVLTGPVGIMVLIAAAAYAIYENWNLVEEAWDGSVQYFKGIWQGIKDATVMDWVKVLGGPFGLAAALIYENWDGVVKYFEGIWQGIKDATVMDWVKVLGGPFGLAAALIYENWDGVVKYFEDIWQGIKDATVMDWVKVLGGPFGLAAALIYENWDGVVKYFEDIWQGIKDATVMDWVKVLGGPFGLAAALIYENWDGMVKYFEDIWQGIKDVFDFEWLNKAAESVSAVFGGGSEAEAVPSVGSVLGGGQQAEAAPFSAHSIACGSCFRGG